jgi:hypothetical protein
MSAVPGKCCRSLPRCASCPVLLARRRRALEAAGPGPEDLFAMLATRHRALPPAVAEQLALLDAARARTGRFDRGANPSPPAPMVAQCFTSTERSAPTA